VCSSDLELKTSSSASARWIGSDTLRDLSSAATAKRLKKKQSRA